MEIIHLHEGSPVPKLNAAIAIGKFESMHRAHRELVALLVREARAAKIGSAVMIFEPSPAQTLRGEAYLPLYTHAERVQFLRECGIDFLICQRFDAAFAALAPQEFCGRLFCALGARLVVVGDGFRFGRGRSGDVQMLHACAVPHGGRVSVMPPMFEGGRIISTSAVRDFVQTAKMPQAAALLGRDFSICGIVQEGRKLGRTLGFPTLNVHPAGKLLPPDGVYATRTSCAHKGIAAAASVTNIGTNPTVDAGRGARRAETFVLPGGMDADLQLYGLEICVEFVRFLREERRFASVDALRAQIAQDVVLAGGG